MSAIWPFLFLARISDFKQKNGHTTYILPLYFAEHLGVVEMFYLELGPNHDSDFKDSS